MVCLATPARAEAAKDPDRAARLPAGRTDAKASPLERADALADFYIPISADAGRLLYALVRASRPATVWKDLCLPVLRLLEPKLAPGALVAADDIDHAGMAGYLDYVRDPANGYVTVAFPVEDGMEISSWTGR